MAEARKCPYCSRVWAKIEGCDGWTYCGERVSEFRDVRDPNFFELATFTFEVHGESGSLRISKSGKKQVKASDRKIDSQDMGIGCGALIKWSEMASVHVPQEARQAVRVGRQKNKINSYFDNTIPLFIK